MKREVNVCSNFIKKKEDKLINGYNDRRSKMDIYILVCMFANRKITGVVTTLFAKLKRKTFHSALYLEPIQPNLKHNLIFKE